MVAGQEAVSLAESFSAGITDVSPLSQMQVCMCSVHVQILDLLHSVIVDMIGFFPTIRVLMLPPRQFHLYIAAALFSYTFFTITSSNSSSFVVLPSIDKGTHGFDGQKERPCFLKGLGNTQSIPCDLCVVWPLFCLGKTASHLTAMDFLVIFGF